MLLLRRIEITNFICFDQIEIRPSANPEKPLTVIRAENGSGKTTLLRAIRWGMYGEQGLPGNPGSFSLHPAAWQPDSHGIETRVSILFETDGSSRHHLEGKPTNIEYELRRSVTTVHRQSSAKGDPDFQRVREDAQLLEREPDGSWVPNVHGVGRVIEELLPWSLRDFFVMDADEAADFVGGSENKEIQRHEVIGKTSFAVRACWVLKSSMAPPSASQHYGKTSNGMRPGPPRTPNWPRSRRNWIMSEADSTRSRSDWSETATKEPTPTSAWPRPVAAWKPSSAASAPTMRYSNVWPTTRSTPSEPTRNGVAPSENSPTTSPESKCLPRSLCERSPACRTTPAAAL